MYYILWNRGTLRKQAHLEITVMAEDTYPEPDVAWDSHDRIGAASQAHMIKEIDVALHPSGDNLVVLIQKQRGDPATKAQRDHILSRSIMRGRLNKALGLAATDSQLNALESMFVADTINGVGTNGEGRLEFLDGIKGLSMFRGAGRRRGLFGGGGDELGE